MHFPSNALTRSMLLNAMARNLARWKYSTNRWFGYSPYTNYGYKVISKNLHEIIELNATRFEKRCIEDRLPLVHYVSIPMPLHRYSECNSSSIVGM